MHLALLVGDSPAPSVVVGGTETAALSLFFFLPAAQVDCYGFGIIMWSLWTGREPFKQVNYHSLLHQMSDPALRLRPPIPGSPDWDGEAAARRALRTVIASPGHGHAAASPPTLIPPPRPTLPPSQPPTATRRSPPPAGAASWSAAGPTTPANALPFRSSSGSCARWWRRCAPAPAPAAPPPPSSPRRPRCPPPPPPPARPWPEALSARAPLPQGYISLSLCRCRNQPPLATGGLVMPEKACKRIHEAGGPNCLYLRQYGPGAARRSFGPLSGRLLAWRCQNSPPW